MEKQDIKKYILKTWSVSSGARIKEMLLRYWDLKENKIGEIELVKKVFDIK